MLGIPPERQQKAVSGCTELHTSRGYFLTKLEVFCLSILFRDRQSAAGQVFPRIDYRITVLGEI